MMGAAATTRVSSTDVYGSCILLSVEPQTTTQNNIVERTHWLLKTKNRRERLAPPPLDHGDCH